MGEFIKFEETTGRLCMFFGGGPVKTDESNGVAESGAQFAALFNERSNPC
jgi:hypothetical protein